MGDNEKERMLNLIKLLACGEVVSGDTAQMLCPNANYRLSPSNWIVLPEPKGSRYQLQQIIDEARSLVEENQQ